MHRRLLVAGSLVPCWSGSTDAAIVYRYASEFPTYTAFSAGSPVSVKLYLEEHISDGSISLFDSSLDADERFAGLIGYGVVVAGDGGASAITAFTSNPDFDMPDSVDLSGLPGSIQVFDGVGYPAVVAPETVTAAVRRVWLGTVSITAEEGTTVFGLLPHPLGSQTLAETVDGTAFFDLDDPAFNAVSAAYEYSGAMATAASFSVLVIPEPTAFALLTILIASLSLPRRSRQLAVD